MYINHWILQQPHEVGTVVISIFRGGNPVRFRKRISKLPEVIHVDMVEWAFNPVGLVSESIL